MMVAKTQGRSEDQNEDFRQNKQQTALLAKPNLHRAGPGGGKKTYKRRSLSALSWTLSPACVRSFLFLSLSLTFLLSSK